MAFDMSARRFIPAGAGNTAPLTSGLKRASVYPRWRGEHTGLAVTANPANGLSPLARGTQIYCIHYLTELRFIPAGAGNTFFCAFRCVTFPVYPRWRGEHDIRSELLINGIGLSPLARGTLNCADVIHQRGRFIPAGAGNTSTLSNPSRVSTVYPRWRGEHIRRCKRKRETIGLSPLARGTRLFVLYQRLYKRFIPAGAGNTV